MGTMGGLLAKAIFGLVVAGCAVPAKQYAQVATLRASAPNEAVRIAPRDARVLASTLGRRFEESPEFKPSAADSTNIKAALATQPLEPKLISVLGLAYDTAGDTEQASSMMQLAARTNRRDVVSGLYLIETASASGDVRSALRHYNAVLSTQPELYSTLLPILASAISYPEIRTALRPYLKGSARWAPPFLATAAESANARDLERLLLPLPGELSRGEYAPALAKVLYRLSLEGDKEAAARFAQAMIPEFSSSELTSLSVSAKTLDKRLGSFAWTFPSVEGVRVDPGYDNSMQISAEPLSRGIVASRDLVIEGPETYQFRQRLDFGSGSSKIVARWTAECITTTGRQRFWEQRLPSNRQQGTYQSVINVPANCKIMRMALEAEGADSQLPSLLNINGLTLTRSR
jgi:tetratricopeptide (TPR) repeat protein